MKLAFWLTEKEFNVLSKSEKTERETIPMYVLSPEDMSDDSDCYPLKAKIWARKSTNEWVLEIDGVINDCNFSVRHTEPLTLKPEDVAGLPSLYNTTQSDHIAELEAKLNELSLQLNIAKDALEIISDTSDEGYTDISSDLMYISKTYFKTRTAEVALQAMDNPTLESSRGVADWLARQKHLMRRFRKPDSL